MSGLRVRALALHADYRCGRSGACCTSGWEIPVELEAEERLRAGLPGAALRLVPVAGLPHGARVRLGCDESGRCLFLTTAGGNRCVIHAQLGEDALPSACRHFPRVVRLTPRGVDVTLSHYCPTVAGRLFEDAPAGGDPDPLLRVVLSPPAFPRSWPFQGLDAREALPPQLRPGVLMSWDGLAAWEAHAVSVLAEARAPEDALGLLGAEAERIRAWTPRDGDFDDFLERVLAAPAEPTVAATHRASATTDPDQASLDAWDEVAATVPRRVPDARPERRSELCAACVSLVAPGWPSFGVPIRRWLAAKVFASWTALQGEGLRTVVAALRLAAGVLRAEAARGCAEAGRALDEALLREAVRRADLLLVHLADPDALARRLSRAER